MIDCVQVRKYVAKRAGGQGQRAKLLFFFLARPPSNFPWTPDPVDIRPFPSIFGVPEWDGQGLWVIWDCACRPKIT